jgi:PEP-CTERM motif
MRFAPTLFTLALSAAASLAHAGITDMPGFQGVRVWEATYYLQAADFNADDPRLVNTLPGAALSFAGRDFGFFAGNENYDLYFSNADGSLNAHGSYLTIDGNCDVPYGCFNISEVALKVNGAYQTATGVVRAVYGRPGSFAPGSAAYVADGSLYTTSNLGDTMGDYPNGRMSVTVSFDGVPAVPEPSTWALFGAGLLAVGRLARQRRA